MFNLDNGVFIEFIVKTESRDHSKRQLSSGNNSLFQPQVKSNVKPTVRPVIQSCSRYLLISHGQCLEHSVQWNNKGMSPLDNKAMPPLDNLFNPFQAQLEFIKKPRWNTTCGALSLFYGFVPTTKE
ncbi:hypothetical protein pdam_00010316 [Pocillopora damicornis]|uniref:Uncharacterized protein n=1 Tax=Pocillopora damicornis TaxID=46731 RepID=A0A3M6UDG3_POCDA|nr:hypothetical protein pdam_00010316 [Pocillopora damicornis]